MRSIRRSYLVVAITGIVGGVSLALVAVATSGGVKHAAPGTPIAALETLPAAADVPTDLQELIARVAGPTNSDPANMLSRVRLLRSSLGTLKSDVYGFADDHGRPCFYVTSSGGGCTTVTNTNTPGFVWAIGGGYPDTPSSLFGVATDDVAAVTLTIDGRDIDVRIVNNFAYAEYSNSSARATITVVYRDGTRSSASLLLK